MVLLLRIPNNYNSAGLKYCMKIRKGESELTEKKPGIIINNYILNLLVILLYTILLSGIGILLSDVVDPENVKRYLNAPLLFALNALPLLFTLMLLFHLTNIVRGFLASSDLTVFPVCTVRKTRLARQDNSNTCCCRAFGRFIPDHIQQYRPV